ncbi:MAG: hypothetical protein DPW09_02715 [Anaerolineae bacterium]|nr:hypothetical protein [Anaerolineae bacterium]
MLTHNLGYPRIGSQRELKKACEPAGYGKPPLLGSDPPASGAAAAWRCPPR